VNIRNTTLTVAVMAIAGSVMVQAQPHRGGPPDLTAIKAYLNLTDAQVTSLHELTKAEHQASQPVASDLRTKHQALSVALRGGTTDAGTLTTMTQAVQAGEQKMQAIRQQYQSQAAGMLTGDQQAKLKALSDAAALMPSVHEAAMLNLIAPPAGGGGGGGGGWGRGGPGGPPAAPVNQ
jgi:Spy/CpxP family protein refolding chaperone